VAESIGTIKLRAELEQFNPDLIVLLELAIVISLVDRPIASEEDYVDLCKATYKLLIHYKNPDAVNHEIRLHDANFPGRDLNCKVLEQLRNKWNNHNPAERKNILANALAEAVKILLPTN
jgi:hypothetical protein